MGNLTKWAEVNSVLDIKSFEDHDITMNENIRKLFFEQIEELNFVSEPVPSNSPRRSYLISLRLDYPQRTEAPYKFLFEAGTKSLIPQYTNTHRVFFPTTDLEKQTLDYLEAYLVQNPKNESKFNPANARDRSNTFNSACPVKEEDVISFTFDESYEGRFDDIDGHLTLYYEKEVIAFQEGNTSFVFLPMYKEYRISRQLKDEGGQRSLRYILYNYPNGLDYKNFKMISRS